MGLVFGVTVGRGWVDWGSYVLIICGGDIPGLFSVEWVDLIRNALLSK